MPLRWRIAYIAALNMTFAAHRCRGLSIALAPVNQLRKRHTYLELIETAKDDGADTMVTLLTHVGWNKPDGLLSIYERTSLTGRTAFSEIGFPDLGPTGVPIHEVLARASRWSTEHGFLRLSQGLRDFITMTWPDLSNLAGGRYSD